MTDHPSTVNSDDPVAGTDHLDDARSALATIADVVDGMTTLLNSFADVDTTLARLCQDLVAAIGDADAAGVTVIRRGRPVTTAWTDAVVHAVDSVQYAADQGPCLDASATRTMVRVDSSTAARRFPEFWAMNAHTGIRSFLSAPLTVDDDHFGALNLYSRDDHGFDSLDAAALRVYVTVAETTFAAAERAADARRQVEGFRQAMDSRAAIEQCKGAMMAVLGITEDTAFDLLKLRSQNTNVPVRRLCEQILVDIAGTAHSDDIARTALEHILTTAHTRVPPHGRADNS